MKTLTLTLATATLALGSMVLSANAQQQPSISPARLARISSPPDIRPSSGLRLRSSVRFRPRGAALIGHAVSHRQDVRGEFRRLGRPSR